jgi:hypothetical protein
MNLNSILSTKSIESRGQARPTPRTPLPFGTRCDGRVEVRRRIQPRPGKRAPCTQQLGADMTRLAIPLDTQAAFLRLSDGGETPAEIAKKEGIPRTTLP